MTGNEASIAEGWAPGLLGWCVAENARHFAEAAGFGVAFEARIAHEMADFLLRLDPPRTTVFRAGDDAGFLGTVSLDSGPDAVEHGLARLRWFLVVPHGRGQGLGHALIARAIAAARLAGHRGIYLWTIEGLDAARRVYERAGFRMVHEADDDTWGKTVREQRFELHF